MAKMRRNHQRSSKGSSFAVRGFLVTVLLMTFLIYGFLKIGPDYINSNEDLQEEDYREVVIDPEVDYLPKGDSKDIVYHKYYALSYNENNEQADWVAYRLTKKSLQAPNVKRAKNFRPDYNVKTQSAFHRDYSNSGYTRGHLVPAADMAFNQQAMEECFYMSNMSPQIRPFNNGIWRELEEAVRDWAYDNHEIYIVSGPIFYDKQKKYIGQNRVAVPDAFFKAVSDVRSPGQKSIAFIIPHKVSDNHLDEYAMSVDELEEELNLDLFPDAYIDRNEENKIESTHNINDWRVEKWRYNARVEKWNHQ